MINNSVLSAVYARRSIRRFKRQPVEREKIDTLVRAAMAAPSTCNLQVWEFIVIDQPERAERVRALSESGSFYAPVVMVLCADTRNVPWKDEDWKIDCAAAVENMMIAAPSLGLGSCWIGSYDMTGLRVFLNIPAEIQVMNLVYFGYPDEQKAAGSKYDQSAVYWQNYDPARGRTLRKMGDPDDRQ